MAMHITYFESAAFASAGRGGCTGGRATAVGYEGKRLVLLLLPFRCRLLKTCFMHIVMIPELQAPHVLWVVLHARDGVPAHLCSTMMLHIGFLSILVTVDMVW